MFSTIKSWFSSDKKQEKTEKRLKVELLEDRAVPANVVWTGATSDDWGVAGNWSDYTPSQDQVGAVRNATPGPGDVVYMNHNGGRNCVIYGGNTGAAGVLRVASDFGFTFRVAGTYYGHGYNFPGYGSYINDDMVLRSFGKMQFAEENVSLRGNITKDGADTSAGEIHLGHNAEFHVLAMTGVGGTRTVEARVFVGSVIVAMNGSTQPSNKGTLNINLAQNDVDFDTGLINVCAPSGTLNINATDDMTRRVLKNSLLNDGLENFGTTNILTNSKDIVINMVIHNAGGVFRMYDGSKITLGAKDPLWQVYFCSYNNSVLSMGHEAVMNGPSVMIDHSTLETYYSGATLAVCPEFTANVYVQNGSSIIANPQDNVSGDWEAWGWYITDSNFHTNADSQVNNSAFTLIANLGSVYFTNSQLFVNFIGNGSALVAGNKWEFFESTTSLVTVNPLPTFTNINRPAPAGTAWDWLFMDANAAAGDDQFYLHLVELLPPPDIDPPPPEILPPPIVEPHP